MKVNNLILDNFNKILVNHDLIYISGITSFGDKFDATGYIAVANDGSSGVCVTDKGDLGLMIQLGGTSSPSLAGTSVGIAPFLTAIEPKNKDMPDFYILHIRDCKNRIILANPDCPEILTFCKDNGRRRWQKKFITGCTIADDDLDPVTEVLKDYIGHKVYLDGRAMIVSAVDGMDNSGHTIVWGFDNIYKITVPVKRNSSVQVENLDSQIVLDISNNPASSVIKTKFKNRVQQVIAASNPQKS